MLLILLFFLSFIIQSFSILAKEVNHETFIPFKISQYTPSKDPSINKNSVSEDVPTKDPIIQNIETSEFEVVNPDETTGSSEGSPASYLRMGHYYMGLKDYEKAEKYFTLAMNEEASVALLYLKAYTGSEEGISNRIEDITPNYRAKAYFKLSQGWEDHYVQNAFPLSEKKKYLELAKEHYSILTVQYPDSIWALKARIKLTTFFLREKKYESALESILPILQIEDDSEIEYLSKDKGWYFLGKILELSPIHNDYDKAIKAYEKVLEFKNSPYASSSRLRIADLRNFYFSSYQAKD